MKQMLKRDGRLSKGFTLVELLIVIGVLGILAAMVLLNVTGVISEGETEIEESELVIVQKAMDKMMAKNALTSVTATSSTQDMSVFPAGNPLYPGYLRMATTSANYSCSSTGQVTRH